MALILLHNYMDIFFLSAILPKSAFNASLISIIVEKMHIKIDH
ncbi:MULTISPECIES: hypothetical protein [unclassified Mammaliicoccus]|nr:MULTISPECIES: hypothetical protein [unclassified Mammaliicoccus]